MHTKSFIILVLCIEFALLKQVNICNVSLGINHSEMDFVSELTLSEPTNIRKNIVEGEVFLQTHSPNLVDINSYPFCQVIMNDQNTSSFSDSGLGIRSAGPATKLSSRNAWGATMAADSYGKGYTFDNALY